MQGPDAAGAAIGVMAGMICMLVAAVAIGSLIGAIILRAACSLFNRLAGSSSAVPEPSFGQALGIVFATTIANCVVSFGARLVIGGGAVAGGMSPQTAQIISSLVSLPIGVLVMSAMLMALLPTTFGRGLLVSLLYLLVGILVGLVIGVIIFAVVAILGVGMMGR
ncbi:MAG: hypothetical protein ACKV0T_01070 [Planctomycetales bacterium]